jgi:hypothetical protein
METNPQQYGSMCRWKQIRNNTGFVHRLRWKMCRNLFHPMGWNRNELLPEVSILQDGQKSSVYHTSHWKEFRNNQEVLMVGVAAAEENIVKSW